MAAKKSKAKAKAKAPVVLNMELVSLAAFSALLLQLQEAGATEIDEAIAWSEDQQAAMRGEDEEADDDADGDELE